jgi:hypothetical protein
LPFPGFNGPSGPSGVLSQQRADIVRAAWQLAVLGDQLAVLADPLAAVPSLGPSIQSLIARLASLSLADPAAASLLVQLQQVSAAPPSIGSLVARIVLLNRLLDVLARTDPLAAQRLAIALPALDTMVMDVLRAQGNGAVVGSIGPDGSASWQAAPGAPLFSSVVSPALAQTLRVLAGALEPPLRDGLEPSVQREAAVLAPGQFVGPDPGRSDDRVLRAGAGAGSAATAPASAPLAPAPSGPFRGGAATSASGGIGSAAPAMALVAVLAVWGMSFFSNRLDLDLAPWRSTLLASRLERPG